VKDRVSRRAGVAGSPISRKGPRPSARPRGRSRSSPAASPPPSSRARPHSLDVTISGSWSPGSSIARRQTCTRLSPSHPSETGVAGAGLLGPRAPAAESRRRTNPPVRASTVGVLSRPSAKGTTTTSNRGCPTRRQRAIARAVSDAPTPVSKAFGASTTGSLVHGSLGHQPNGRRRCVLAPLLLFEQPASRREPARQPAI